MSSWSPNKWTHVETGTHDELMKARGFYFHLCSQQLGPLRHRTRPSDAATLHPTPRGSSPVDWFFLMNRRRGWPGWQGGAPSAAAAALLDRCCSGSWNRPVPLSLIPGRRGTQSRPPVIMVSTDPGRRGPEVASGAVTSRSDPTKSRPADRATRKLRTTSTPRRSAPAGRSETTPRCWRSTRRRTPDRPGTGLPDHLPQYRPKIRGRGATPSIQKLISTSKTLKAQLELAAGQKRTRISGNRRSTRTPWSEAARDRTQSQRSEEEATISKLKGRIASPETASGELRIRRPVCPCPLPRHGYLLPNGIPEVVRPDSN